VSALDAGALIVSEYAIPLLAIEFASVAVTVKLYVPGVLHVPATAPPAARVIAPAQIVPDVIEYVSGAVPLLPEIVFE
jgi:hypothetical protein